MPNPAALHWPAVQPIAAGLAGVLPFDPRWLPERIRPWVSNIAEQLQVPLDYPAVGAITMLAGVIGRRAWIHPQRYGDWAVVPNLWGAIVGRPGVMKTPVLRAVLGPLLRRQAFAMTVYESEQEAYEEQLEAHRVQLRSRRLAPVRGAGAEQPGRLQNPVPHCTRYLVNEATIEKVHLILKENPQGVLYLRDELSGWLAQMDQRVRERAFFLETWDGNSGFTFDRLGRGTVHASRLCLSVLGGMQPTRLREYVSAAAGGGVGDDGLLQRFQLLVWPDIGPEWEEVDRPTEVWAERRVEEAVERLLGISPDDPLRMRFSPEAQERFRVWRRQLEQKIRGGGLEPALESHLAKARSLMPKLALIFHLIEDGTSEEVPAVQAERAVEICGYLESHARRVYGSAASRPLRLAAALGEKLRRGCLGNRFRIPDIYLRGWTGLDTLEQARTAVGVLADAGWIVRQVRGGGEEFWLNPEICEAAGISPVAAEAECLSGARGEAGVGRSQVPGSKTAQVVELLRRPGGASLQELAAVTGWRANSIRGLLSGTLGKRKGLRIQSRTNGGERRYFTWD